MKKSKKKPEWNFKPLPKSVKLKKSKIHGYGIFAKRDLYEGEIIGVSHIEDYTGYHSNGLIRTALGAYINHSEYDNCTLESNNSSPTTFFLRADMDIAKNAELTLDYLEYQCGEGYNIGDKNKCE